MDFQERLQTTLGTAYRVERELGGGGMSRTFVAAETSLGRSVVVKVLPPDLAAGVSSERFRKEIHLAASLQHPHIVSVLSAGQGDDLLYYTMPLIEGATLRARLHQSGELPIADAVHILRDVARALAYAHRRGVVHRDIKPENILLSEDGAMVADFGVAKAISASTSGDTTTGITGSGVALGTPAYMSPEQAAADPQTDQRTDIYSLGVVAYELLAGFSPFAGRPTSAVFAAHANEIPAPIEKRRANVPQRLATLVSRCLQKRPADRPQTAEAVLQELDAIAQQLTAPHAAVRQPWWKSRPTQIAGVGVALALAAGAYFGGHAAMSPAEKATQGRTIAVLPFANIGESKDDESFADGITAELIGAFGKVDQLRVKSASSLKGSRQDDRDLGKQLDVESVVAGSVRRSGDKVRISARLVNVADGFQLWTDTYERELRNTADVFGIQDEITKAIVSALKLKLSLSGRSLGQATRQTANLEAYRAMQNGRYFMAKRTPEGIRTAIGFFEDAVAKDSNYALAWDGLADANALLNTYAFVEPTEVFARARAAVARALSLDSTLAEGYATSAYIGLNNTWDWPAVEGAFKRSIELDPNYATAHHWFSLYLDAMGRGPEALKQIQRALELDPVSLVVNREEGRTYYYTGDNEHALQQYRRTLELDPTFRSVHVWIARAYIAQGKYSEAIDELRDQPDFQGGHGSAVLAYAYAKAGQRPQAAAILEELQARAKRENVWPMYIGLVQMALGNRDAALGLIETEYYRRSAQMAYVGVDPIFAEFHREPRFRQILAKMKLPAH